MAQGKLLFAIVREAECEALKRLSGNAVKLWIAIRYGRREGEPFAIGCRDFKEWGLGRDAAAKALQELVEANLLSIVERGSFGRRGRRTIYSIVHTKAYERKQSGITDNKSAKSPGMPTTNDKTVRVCRQQTRKESVNSDTPKDTPAPAEQEQGAGVSVNIEENAERERELQLQKERSRRIERNAKRFGWSDKALMDKAGGPKAADFLCRKLESGQFTEQQFRARLAESDKGSGTERSETLTPRKIIQRSAYG